MTNQNNILTEEEIKELIGSLNRNPSEAEIGAVIDYFWLRPYALKHLEDKEFRKSFVRLIYLHKIALDGYKKADKEVKSLQSLTTSLEKERNELLEINKQLEVKLEEKDNRIEELEERVEIEQEMSMKALDKAEEWHERKNFVIAMQKDVFIFSQQQTIEKLRKDLDARDEKIAKLTNPKKFQQLRKLTNKTKEKVAQKLM